MVDVAEPVKYEHVEKMLDILYKGATKRHEALKRIYAEYEERGDELIKRLEQEEQEEFLVT